MRRCRCGLAAPCKWGRFSRINIKPQFSRVLNRFEFTRPDQVTDVAGSTTVVASIRYLGLGTLVGLNYNNPLFPALRSGPTAVSGASRQKQIPSSGTDGAGAGMAESGFPRTRDGALMTFSWLSTGSGMIDDEGISVSALAASSLPRELTAEYQKTPPVNSSRPDKTRDDITPLRLRFPDADMPGGVVP